MSLSGCYLSFSPTSWCRIRRHPIDFTGLVLVGTGLGALQVVFDKGQREDWFSSSLITIFTIVSCAALVSFTIRELNSKYPILNLRLLRNSNFAVSNRLMLMLGATLYGTTVLIPQFLQTQMGYSAQKAGEVLSPGGFLVLLMMPAVGFLVSRVDARYLIAAGFLTVGYALFRMTDLTLGIDYHTAMLWRCYQAAGLAFLFVPINTIAFVGTPPEASNQVSGLLNLMRNLGGSVGISAVTTLIARRQQEHQFYLARNTFAANPHIPTCAGRDDKPFQLKKQCSRCHAASLRSDIFDRTTPSNRARVYRYVLDHGYAVPACDRTAVLC